MHIASPTTYKTEVKYLIPDLSKLPADILAALETGQEHTAILKRGLIRQDYLAVTRKNIFNLYRALTAAGLPLGSEEDRTLFMLPGKTQEIRFMRKFLKVQGAVQTIYQVVIQGSGTILNIKVETPEVLTAAQLDKMKHLFEAFQSEINDCVCKVYFEVPLRYLTDLAGDKRTVEIDIFFKSHPDHLRPFFIDGEIKFHNSTPIQATPASIALSYAESQADRLLWIRPYGQIRSES